MKTTGINKTVYRCDNISALDSFTSVRNVLAWEMFQDGQVRNYDGVIGDLKRLYPDIDFDSVTKNVDPESIAANEDAIYSVVDDILNKLIENGISRDNFNYAIWACDNPENVADTYGVDIDDVSAYKITDGILLQDLGYEGQLYGVAEYPEEEWDIIESGLNGVNDVLRIPSKIPPISKENKKIETENVNKTDNHNTLNVQDINGFNAMADIATKILYDTIMQSSNLSITVNQLKFIYTSFLIKYLDDETITQSDLEEKLKEYNSKLSPEIVSAIVSAFFLKRKKRTEDGEEYYEISNSFQGGNMETREDYKDYYLEELIENYGDMTERDYNSAQKFCYDEEWNLGEVGNMAEAIDGLGDAWTEYQKQYKEGFEIMNNWNIKPIDSSLEPDWTVYEPNFKNLKPRHESDPENGWGTMEGQQKKIIEDNDHKVVVEYGYSGSCTLYGAETGEVISPFSTIKDMQDFKKKNNLTIVKNSRRNNMKKTIKSVYTLDRNEIDEFEQASPDLGVKFDEPLLIVHDNGYIYNHEGFEKYINEITQLYPDNWENANEAYHTDSIEEFIDMCESAWFRHDFGGAFDFYREGLKQMAESTISEVPADGQPFSIKNGFAFKLLSENETDFDVENPYWVDDYSLQRIDGFFCQINPSVGNQFDVVIDPDYFNVPEGETVVTSSRKLIKSSSMIYKENEMPSVMKDRIYWEIYYYNEGDNKELGTQNRYDSVRGMSFTQAKRRAKQLMRDYNCDTACMQTTGGNGVIIKNDSIGDKNMKIQSKRAIKSGTSNFGSNDDVFGYQFPLVTYVAENYYYDEETDSETEERDYEADDWEYRDALDEAKDLADEMDIPQYDDYSEPYLCHEPFMIKFRDGYYEGLWIEVKEGTDEEDIYNTNEYGSYYDGGRPFTDEEMNKFADKLNEYFNKLCSDYGWQKLGVTARFSNGETMYHKIDNSRESVTSGLTFRQAVQDFKAAGQWNDYYEMQQDWEAYKDGLERDGVISEKTRSTWGNPCTPEGFKKWNK